MARTASGKSMTQPFPFFWGFSLCGIASLAPWCYATFVPKGTPSRGSGAPVPYLNNLPEDATVYVGQTINEVDQQAIQRARRRIALRQRRGAVADAASDFGHA